MKQEDRLLLQRLTYCVYIVLGLLAINTIILLANNIHVVKDNEIETEEKESTKEYDVSMMNSVDMDELIKLFDSKDTQVVYIGRSTCGYCVQFLPALKKAQKEYGYKTNYLNISEVSESDAEKLLEKDNDEKFLEENYGATPMVLLVKDGKLQDTWVGYSEYNEFAQFLEENGFKK